MINVWFRVGSRREKERRIPSYAQLNAVSDVSESDKLKIFCYEMRKTLTTTTTMAAAAAAAKKWWLNILTPEEKSPLISVAIIWIHISIMWFKHELIRKQFEIAIEWIVWVHSFSNFIWFFCPLANTNSRLRAQCSVCFSLRFSPSLCSVLWHFIIVWMWSGVEPS